MAGPEQPLQRPFRIAPFPPAGSPLVGFEIRGRHGAVALDAFQKRHGLGPPFAGVELHLPPAGLAAVGLGHAPPQERVQVERDQGRLMRPVLEQSALARRPPRKPVQVGALIAAQPREGRQVVRARQHVDAVDLMQVQMIDCAPEMKRRWSLGPAAAESLGGQRHPARLRQADRLHARLHPAHVPIE
ncbi:hypothetical protein D3C72_1464190 [compost metagenome]